ncbi:MAG: hypothetical protein QOC96_3259 [Acidobacteriota bacterium]|jgi:hypothetical protein|nr:hypothetical protein [Acidobacteriota bacterium]
MSKRSIAAYGIPLVIMLVTTVSAYSQTSSELRKKYGEPEILKLKDGEPEVERYNVSPSIRLTVTYAKKGQLYELLIEPVPSPPPQSSSSVGDLMPTETVINLINELVPITLRGKFLGAGTMNGGDPEMKLDHPGCSGVYFAYYKHVIISCVTWCWGGTFSARIRWEETKFQRQPSERKNKS